MNMIEEVLQPASGKERLGHNDIYDDPYNFKNIDDSDATTLYDSSTDDDVGSSSDDSSDQYDELEVVDAEGLALSSSHCRLTLQRSYHTIACLLKSNSSCLNQFQYDTEMPMLFTQFVSMFEVEVVDVEELQVWSMFPHRRSPKLSIKCQRFYDLFQTVNPSKLLPSIKGEDMPTCFDQSFTQKQYEAYELVAVLRMFGLLTINPLQSATKRSVISLRKPSSASNDCVKGVVVWNLGYRFNNPGLMDAQRTIALLTLQNKHLSRLTNSLRTKIGQLCVSQCKTYCLQMFKHLENKRNSISRKIHLLVKQLVANIVYHVCQRSQLSWSNCEHSSPVRLVIAIKQSKLVLTLKSFLATPTEEQMSEIQKSFDSYDRAVRAIDYSITELFSSQKYRVLSQVHEIWSCRTQPRKMRKFLKQSYKGLQNVKHLKKLSKSLCKDLLQDEDGNEDYLVSKYLNKRYEMTPNRAMFNLNQAFKMLSDASSLEVNFSRASIFYKGEKKRNAERQLAQDAFEEALVSILDALTLLRCEIRIRRLGVYSDRFSADRRCQEECTRILNKYSCLGSCYEVHTVECFECKDKSDIMLKNSVMLEIVKEKTQVQDKQIKTVAHRNLPEKPTLKQQ